KKVRRAGGCQRAGRKANGDRAGGGLKADSASGRTKRSLPVRQRQEIQTMLLTQTGPRALDQIPSNTLAQMQSFVPSLSVAYVTMSFRGPWPKNAQYVALSSRRQIVTLRPILSRYGSTLLTSPYGNKFCAPDSFDFPLDLTSSKFNGGD